MYNTHIQLNRKHTYVPLYIFTFYHAKDIILVKFSFSHQNFHVYIQLPTVNNRYKILNILYLYSNLASLKNLNLSVFFCSCQYVMPDIINIHKLTPMYHFFKEVYPAYNFINLSIKLDCLLRIIYRQTINAITLYSIIIYFIYWANIWEYLHLLDHTNSITFDTTTTISLYFALYAIYSVKIWEYPYLLDHTNSITFDTITTITCFSILYLFHTLFVA